MAKSFCSNGYQILGHRLKLFGVEIDLVFWKAGILTLSEVKSSTNPNFISTRVSKTQRNRQVQVVRGLIGSGLKDVEFHLCLVDIKGNVTTIEHVLI